MQDEKLPGNTSIEELKAVFNNDLDLVEEFTEAPEYILRHMRNSIPDIKDDSGVELFIYKMDNLLVGLVGFPFLSFYRHSLSMRGIEVAQMENESK